MASIFMSILLILLISTSLMAADSHIEKGKKYIFIDIGDKSVVIVQSKPDNFGWVKVKVIQGHYQGYIGKEGYVNLNNVMLAKEVK